MYVYIKVYVITYVCVCVFSIELVSIVSSPVQKTILILALTHRCICAT